MHHVLHTIRARLSGLFGAIARFALVQSIVINNVLRQS